MATASNGGQVLSRNKLSAWDWITMILTMLPLPVVLLWAMIKSPFSALGRSRSWKRILFDSATLWALANLNRRQIRLATEDAPGTYSAYMKSKRLKPVVEEIGENGRLLGSKTAERVILYLHDAFGRWWLAVWTFRIVTSSLVFWSYVQENLQKRGKPTGVALLNYSLVPDATFPTQLKQAVLAIQHLIYSGVKPENIQLAGDSAGGLIIHQVFSHIRHPVDGVPQLKLTAPLGGAYMMSPWVATLDDEALHTNDNAGDILSASILLYWGRKIHEGVPALAIPYLNANGAPGNWLKGLDKVVKQILISAGDAEVLRDPVIKYFKTVEKYHKRATLFLQEKGAHDEAFLLFFVGEDDPRFAPYLLDWLDKGFSQVDVK